jgi:RNA polymerase sigma-70 factor (ECF subfamily)
MDINDYQNRLFPYAYNILGTYDDAKDVIQDVMAKYYSFDKTGIDNENNYLIRSVINQSINLRKRNNRSTITKQLLPEPISTENADGNIIRKEIISYSLLVLLETVNAKERAVFILKEAFDYAHEEIGDILQISTENSRKLLSRAKVKLEESRENKVNSTFTDRSQLENYIHALKNGNLSALETMLLADIEVKVDGGKLNIVSAYERGINSVIGLMTKVYKTYQTEMQVKIAMVNHQLAILFYQDNILINCQVFDFEVNTSLIKSIYSIVDPEKLKNFNKL